MRSCVVGTPQGGTQWRPSLFGPGAIDGVEGVLGNVLNPKAGIIFVTVLPQFVKTGDGALRLVLMLAVFEAVLVCWLSLYGHMVVRAAGGRAGRRVRRLVSRITGVVLIGLGVRLATERG